MFSKIFRLRISKDKNNSLAKLQLSANSGKPLPTYISFVHHVDVTCTDCTNCRRHLYRLYRFLTSPVWPVRYASAASHICELIVRPFSLGWKIQNRRTKTLGQIFQNEEFPCWNFATPISLAQVLIHLCQLHNVTKRCDVCLLTLPLLL